MTTLKGKDTVLMVVSIFLLLWLQKEGFFHPLETEERSCEEDVEIAKLLGAWY
jgi:hypothetical protein